MPRGAVCFESSFNLELNWRWSNTQQCANVLISVINLKKKTYRKAIDLNIGTTKTKAVPANWPNRLLNQRPDQPQKSARVKQFVYVVLCLTKVRFLHESHHFTNKHLAINTDAFYLMPIANQSANQCVLHGWADRVTTRACVLIFKVFVIVNYF